jgi:hypothetical protein
MTEAYTACRQPAMKGMIVRAFRIEPGAGVERRQGPMWPTTDAEPAETRLAGSSGREQGARATASQVFGRWDRRHGPALHDLAGTQSLLGSFHLAGCEARDDLEDTLLQLHGGLRITARDIIQKLSKIGFCFGGEDDAQRRFAEAARMAWRTSSSERPLPAFKEARACSIPCSCSVLSAGASSRCSLACERACFTMPIDSM